jgi:transcriptional regulator with XRE-family HTH domain
MTRPSWLSTAARRSSERKWTLGHVLEKYRQFENKSSEELAMELGCSLETLEWLELCSRPNEDTFAEDLNAIAERFNVDPNGLASVIRHAESLGVFAARQEDGQAVRETRLMLAAWDRDSDDEENS